MMYESGLYLHTDYEKRLKHAHDFSVLDGFISFTHEQFFPHVSAFFQMLKHSDNLKNKPVCLKIMVTTAEQHVIEYPKAQQYFGLIRSDFPSGSFSVITSIEGAVNKALSRLLDHYNLVVSATGHKGTPPNLLNLKEHFIGVEFHPECIHLCFCIQESTELQVIGKTVTGIAVWTPIIPQLKSNGDQLVIALSVPLMDFVNEQSKIHKVGKEVFVVDLIRKKLNESMTTPPSNIDSDLDY